MTGVIEGKYHIVAYLFHLQMCFQNEYSKTTSKDGRVFVLCERIAMFADIEKVSMLVYIFMEAFSKRECFVSVASVVTVASKPAI